MDDLMEWAAWYEQANEERIVRQETIGDYWVSTVFLALDHRWDDGPPILFETMVFWAERDENGRKGVVDDAPIFRAATWEIALEHHAEACAWVKEQVT